MKKLPQSRKEIIILCHPGGIYAIVGAAFSSNCIDSFRMTLKNSSRLSG